MAMDIFVQRLNNVFRFSSKLVKLSSIYFYSFLEHLFQWSRKTKSSLFGQFLPPYWPRNHSLGFSVPVVTRVGTTDRLAWQIPPCHAAWHPLRGFLIPLVLASEQVLKLVGFNAPTYPRAHKGERGKTVSCSLTPSLPLPLSPFPPLPCCRRS